MRRALPLLLAAACEPADPTEPNRAPWIESATADAACDGEAEFPALCVDHDGYPVFVVATDPDEDALVFEWELSESGLLPSTELDSGSQQQSTVVLATDELQDGEVLTCWVGDGELIVSQRWSVFTD
jgi:hypothetical protein